ncbi:MAG: UDP-N-acetylmuramate dehydrogenase [Parcubacteria group bacterium LiPW_72]|nr:MAG: UDP-N-acetylmuramate dehydrogenase [Parcubacteria group bacterium LiPW_72]
MRDIFSKSWKKELAGLRISEDLKKYTTFKIGGPADYFFTAKSKKDIIKAVGVAQDLKLPYYILGGGSNVLVADSGFRGLVIQIANQELECRGREIHCGAGLTLGALIQKSLNQGLAGLEDLSGIPGTVGGAIYGNAGAFGHFIGEKVKTVWVLDPKHSQVKVYTQKECQFGYRESVFKRNHNIILDADFVFEPAPDKKRILKKIERAQAVRARHPYKNCAGSVFKNIPFHGYARLSWLRQIFRQSRGLQSEGSSEKQGERFLKNVPSECVQYGEIKAACLIEKLGLKNKMMGGAAISEQHANFIVNKREAKAKDVLDLIDLVRKKVYKKYRIVLETEIQFVGF